MLRRAVLEARLLSLSHVRVSANEFQSSSTSELRRNLLRCGSQRAFASKPDEPTFLDNLVLQSGMLERRDPDKYSAILKKLIVEYNSYNQVMPDFRKPREDHLLDRVEDRLNLFWNRFYTKFACFRSITGWKSSQVEEAAKEAFQAVNAAVASGDIKALDSIKDLMAPKCYSQLRQRIAKQSQRLHVEWSGEVLEAKIMDGDHDKVLPESVRGNQAMMQIKGVNSLSSAQFVVKLVSKQKFKATNYAGVVVAGGDEPMTYEDYWVFERLFFKSIILRKPGPMGARWRLLAQLSQADMDKIVDKTEGSNYMANIFMGLGFVVIAGSTYVTYFM